MDWIVDWIKKIILCMILGNLFIHLVPREAYQKYVKLFWGFVLLLVFINPIYSLFSGAGKLSKVVDAITLELHKEEAANVIEHGLREASDMEKEYLDEVLEEKLKENLGKDQYTVRKIVTNWNEKKVESVNVWIEKKSTDAGGREAVENKIKNYIGDFYTMEMEHIYIAIQED